MKLLIGLTGLTGSGKSIAAKYFENLGAFVIDCDKLAHSVLFREEVKKEIKEKISSSVFDDFGNADRKKLGKIVFSDKKALQTLNGIVHPAVTEEILRLAENSKKDIVVIDGSELEASGIDKKCNHIVVVSASPEVRLKRIMLRDGIDRETALMRIQAQSPYSKEALIIENNCDEKEFETAVKKIFNKFAEEINA